MTSLRARLGTCVNHKNSKYKSSHKHSNQHEQDHTQHMSITYKAKLYHPTETTIERQCKQKQYHRANEVSKQSSKQASKLNTCDRKQARNLCKSYAKRDEAIHTRARFEITLRFPSFLPDRFRGWFFICFIRLWASRAPPGRVWNIACSRRPFWLILGSLRGSFLAPFWVHFGIKLGTVFT